jgi:hypothetical protein
LPGLLADAGHDPLVHHRTAPKLVEILISVAEK